jgi:hypothetical protein
VACSIDEHRDCTGNGACYDSTNTDASRILTSIHARDIRRLPLTICPWSSTLCKRGIATVGRLGGVGVSSIERAPKDRCREGLAEVRWALHTEQLSFQSGYGGLVVHRGAMLRLLMSFGGACMRLRCRARPVCRVYRSKMHPLAFTPVVHELRCSLSVLWKGPPHQSERVGCLPAILSLRRCWELTLRFSYHFECSVGQSHSCVYIG